MKLTITFQQHGKKFKSVVTPIDDKSANFEILRKLWDVEQVLNNIPGANLRVHISVEE